MRTALTTALAAVAVLAAGSASATIWDITYSGILEAAEASGAPAPPVIDQLGLFGPSAGAFKNGDAVTVTFVVDDSKGSVITPLGPPQAIHGGMGADDPVLSAAIAFDGVGYTLSPADGFGDYDIAPPGVTESHLETSANNANDSVTFFVTVDADTPVPDHLTPFSAAVTNGGQFLAHTPSDGDPDQDVSETFVHFELDHVAIASTSPAPEPAAWALMILGFGAAGAALRRRTPLTRLA